MCHPQCGFYGAAIIQLGALIVALVLVGFVKQFVEPAQPSVIVELLVVMQTSGIGPAAATTTPPGASSASRDEKSNPRKTCRRGGVRQLQRFTRNRKVGYGSSANVLGQQH
jgi:hypothetical protein